MRPRLEIKQFIHTRYLPKTGQITSYVSGDDGQYEFGWWFGRLNADNMTRFLARTIGGHDVVIDLATGLMWAADGHGAGCANGNTITWSNGIAFATGLTFASFSDWRIPNVQELGTLTNHGKGSTPRIYAAFFPNTAAAAYWTSTTDRATTTKSYIVSFYNCSVLSIVKTNSYEIRCVRTA